MEDPQQHQEDQDARADNLQASQSGKKDRTRQQIVSVLFFSFFVALWVVLFFLNREVFHLSIKKAYEPKFVVVEIEQGSSLGDIAEKLSSQGLINNRPLFKAVALLRGSARELKAGEYRFDRSMSLLQVIRWLEQGRIMLHKFTVPEGSTVEEAAKLLSNKKLAGFEEVLALASNERFCRQMGLDIPNLEGYLFPETYKIAKGLPAKQVVRIMVERFWRVWNEEVKKSAHGKEANIKDIIVIASIIEKEAVHDDEEPLISSVIYNRLRLNMPLQCDVTIRYPLKNYGVDLTSADLLMDSPFNSYRHKGLPPTPICSPGRMAIRAALDPPKTNYLYFVSMNNGYHKFSTNLADHNAAVLKYQVMGESEEEPGSEEQPENAKETKS